MAKSILHTIERNMPTFSKGQKRIADYILQNYDKAAFMTASKLGKLSGVSESTVVRFASELGYDGYPSMQRALQEMIRSRLTSTQRIQAADNLFGGQDVLSAVIQSDMDKLRMVAEEADRTEFNKVVDLILGAGHLYILGVRTSSFVAGYLNFYLHLLSENVTLVQSNAAGEIFEQLLRIGPGDVMIAISFPRYSKVTMNTVKFAQDRGATIVAITDNELSPVYQMAEAALLAPSEMISFVDSMVAPLSLINALLIAVGSRMRSANVPRNGKFLYSAFSRFDGRDTMAFFASIGVPLKTERGNRVFPVSDRAFDVSAALERRLKALKVSLVRDRATELEITSGAVTGVRGERGTYPAGAVVLATGGVSYPATGSTGEGHRMAREAGHTVTDLQGSLVPLRDYGLGRELQGLSLRNVGLAVFEDRKKIYTDFGEMQFTHFGVSGPLLLSASAHMRHFGNGAVGHPAPSKGP